MSIKNRNEKLDFLHNIKKEVEIHSLLAETLPKLGFKDVTISLYENGRHEILNDVQRDDVAKEIIAWLNAHIA